MKEKTALKEGIMRKQKGHTKKENPAFWSKAKNGSVELILC